MNLITNEVNFLKEFRKRFTTNTDYKNALGDLLDAGLISTIAYDEAISAKKKKSTIINPRDMVTDVVKTMKKIKKAPTQRRTRSEFISGCGSAIKPSRARSTFRSTCDSRESNC